LARLAVEVCAAGGAPPAAPHANTAGPAPRADPALDSAAEIVSVCELLDEQLEALPFDSKPVDAILDDLQAVICCEGVRPELVDAIRGLRYRGLEPAAELGRRLPVQARLAQQLFSQLGAGREYDIEELEAVANQDPVLAGSLIQVANSALYGAEQRIGMVRHAIAYVGAAAARQVMLAAVMRPLFASAGLVRLWSHAVQMAQLCAALAGQTQVLEPGSAVLLGLVHDIGSLALHMLPRDVVERYQRLTQHGGCPPTYVEQLLFGCDHGEIGAGVLDGWSFPEHLVEAVRLHHQPERSPSDLTSLVYLAEFWSGLDEDLPSLMRVQQCSRRTGLSLDSLASVRIGKDALDRLRTVA
jgi:HD-like signal output (HDOD) protein